MVLTEARTKSTTTSRVVDPCRDIAVLDTPVEEWVAVNGGIFQRATFDMPNLLYENDLTHLYDKLLHLDLYDLWQKSEIDRTVFLAHLKDEVGLSSLADRQHFANALARAKRLGKWGDGEAQ